MVQNDLEKAAELGAEKAVAKIMLMLGVDITDKEDVRAHKADLQNARKVRLAGERIGAAALLIVVGAIVTGALSFLWNGFKSGVSGH